ncbi:MAG: hypothetical protein RLZZ50_1794 [Verrucomicrobiota bacterium]
MNRRRQGARSLLVGAAVAWALCAHLVPGAFAQPLVVATYNARNYTSADRLTPDGFRPDYPKPEAEKTALRQVIKATGADVIALQEMGGPGYLSELRRDLAAEGLDYPFGEAMLAADEHRGLAVLSRVPLGAITRHVDLLAKRRGAEEPEAVRRGLFQVEVPRASGAITLFVLHLKSRLAVDRDDPLAEDQRVAEAQAVRDRILRVFPDPSKARFLVLGDFNDLPGSRAFEAMESRGKLKVASWVSALDSRGHAWTHSFASQGLYSRFDHVFVADGWRHAITRAWIEDSEATALASDHRPVVVQWGDL